MPNEKDKSRRRVYVLPTDLYERVLRFQKQQGLTSEVHAVRRLLDDALAQRDLVGDIIARYIKRLADVHTIADAARDVLVTHPLVKEIQMTGVNKIRFITETIEGIYWVEIPSNGQALVSTVQGWGNLEPWES